MPLASLKSLPGFCTYGFPFNWSLSVGHGFTHVAIDKLILVNIQTYLHFPSKCELAIEKYKEAFGAEVIYLSHFSEAPGEFSSSEFDNLVFHATVKVGETVLNMADDPLKEKSSFGGFTLLVHFDSESAFEQACALLGDAGSFIWGPTQTPWAQNYAVVKDEFGVTWKLQHSES